jgi:hypothetical protein
MRNHLIARIAAIAILLTLAGCSKNSSSTSSSPDTSNSAANTAPTPPPPVTIDAGTVLVLTLDQSISTKTNNSGDRFQASLAVPVTVNGTEVLPRGTRATGTVVQAQPAGRIKGGSILELTLDSISANGQSYAIQTSEFEEAGKGRGKRTAIGGGGGAAFGAIVGALAGGGKGAAIGALAGGGAGTAGAAFTGKRDITLPAETRLHFRLRTPLSISQQ